MFTFMFNKGTVVIAGAAAEDDEVKIAVLESRRRIENRYSEFVPIEFRHSSGLQQLILNRYQHWVYPDVMHAQSGMHTTLRQDK